MFLKLRWGEATDGGDECDATTRPWPAHAAQCHAKRTRHHAGRWLIFAPATARPGAGWSQGYSCKWPSLESLGRPCRARRDNGVREEGPQRGWMHFLDKPSPMTHPVVDDSDGRGLCHLSELFQGEETEVRGARAMEKAVNAG